MNPGPTPYLSWSIVFPTGDIVGTLNMTDDALLQPFASNPLLSEFDWTNPVCTAAANGTTTCTTMQSPLVAEGWAAICGFEGWGALCSDPLSDITAAEIEQYWPKANPCTIGLVYVLLGVIPGCDLTFTTPIADEGFKPFTELDIVGAGVAPAPLSESSSSLSLLLVGLAALFLLRRKLASPLL